MRRLYGLVAILATGLFGCGDGGGGPKVVIPPFANAEGKWVGTMDHDINGKPYHYDVALLLHQDGSHVTGMMILEYDADGHGGRIDGQMRGNHFTGTRTATHVVDIEFDVSGDMLVGTFTFVSPEENLNEHGTFVCRREPGTGEGAAKWQVRSASTRSVG